MNKEKNKYSIAWFSLSECIVRGEREKALGVFRLLSHSLTDKALVHQLKGDIYLSFNDCELALQEYIRAAKIYMENKQLHEACSVYEHITYQLPNSLEHSFTLFLLYYKQGIITRAKKELLRIAPILAKKESFASVQEFIIGIKNKSYVSALCLDIINVLLTQSADKSYMYMCMYAMLDIFIQNHNTTQLQHFLTHLQSLEIELYNIAQEYTNKK